MEAVADQGSSESSSNGSSSAGGEAGRRGGCGGRGPFNRGMGGRGGRGRAGHGGEGRAMVADVLGGTLNGAQTKEVLQVGAWALLVFLAVMVRDSCTLMCT